MTTSSTSRVAVVAFSIAGVSFATRDAQAQAPGQPVTAPASVPLTIVGESPFVGGQAPISANLGMPNEASIPPRWVVPRDCEDRPGLLGRCVQRVRYGVRDKMIGYPQYFDEPPLGWSLYQNAGRAKNKADVHTFTLYRSDFVAGGTQLSPGGARRLSFMSSRLATWPGPVVVEWTPETPDLALARRDAVLAAMHAADQPLLAQRVVVGPSAFRGLIGPDAGNNHDALIFRDYTAPRAYSVTPTSTDEFGGGAR